MEDNSDSDQNFILLYLLIYYTYTYIYDSLYRVTLLFAWINYMKVWVKHHLNSKNPMTSLEPLPSDHPETLSCKGL